MGYSTGSFGISHPLLAAPLCSIMNASLQQSRLPSIWKCAAVTPLTKVKVLHNIKTDLRPISLTPVVSKVNEEFVVQWLWRIVGHKIDPMQFGSVRNSSTTFALVELMHHCFSATDASRHFVHLLLLDYKKAFDLIDHTLLLPKLVALGVPNCLVNWIRAFLTNRQQQVKIGKSLSHWSTTNGGVPQGTKLGPVLFAIMINDLKPNPGSMMLKYVDDTTVWCSGAETRNTNLQNAASSAERWAKENNMQINPTKTKDMVIDFSKKRHHTSNSIVMDGSNIESVKVTKLLGVYISDDLTWNAHIDYITSKASQRIYHICALKRAGVTDQDMVGVYKSIIQPILEYASPVWHPGLSIHLSDKIENIQKRVLKCVFPGIPYTEALRKAELQTLYDRRQHECLKLYKNMQNRNHKLFHLLPQKKQVPYMIRNPRTFSLPKIKTKRTLGSFINWCIFNLQ